MLSYLLFLFLTEKHPQKRLSEIPKTTSQPVVIPNLFKFSIRFSFAQAILVQCDKKEGNPFLLKGFR